MELGKRVHEAIAFSLEKKEIPLLDQETRILRNKALSILGSKKPVVVERGFKLSINGEDVLRGYIDLVFRKDLFTFSLWDWKTGWGEYEVHERPHQLFLYAWACHELEIFVSEVSFVFVRRKKIVTEQVTIEKITKSIRWAKRLIRDARYGHELLNAGLKPEEAFKPCAGNACRTCSFILECPISKKYDKGLGL